MRIYMDNSGHHRNPPRRRSFNVLISEVRARLVKKMEELQIVEMEVRMTKIREEEQRYREDSRERKRIQQFRVEEMESRRRMEMVLQPHETKVKVAELEERHQRIIYVINAMKLSVSY